MEKTVTLSIDGMSCEHCVRAVKDALTSQKGVKSVDVSLEGKNATVVFDDELAALSALESAVIEEGYQVTGK